jgi:hypothetical protein
MTQVLNTRTENQQRGDERRSRDSWRTRLAISSYSLPRVDAGNTSQRGTDDGRSIQPHLPSRVVARATA